MRPTGSLLLLALLLGLAGGVGRAQTPPAPPNVLPNGGFEEWVPADQVLESARNQEENKLVKLGPEGLWPRWWDPGWNPMERGVTPSGTVARDDQVKHAGQFSVRLTNLQTADLTFVQYRPSIYLDAQGQEFAVKPNMRYLLRWWVKGEVETGAGAPLLLAFVMSRDAAGQESRYNFGQPGDTMARGTFDWTQREVSFVTGPEAVWLALSFQLRGCKGTAWFDDIELIEDLPVTPVQVY